MFQELLEKNIEHIRTQKSFRTFTSELQSITQIINTQKIITISGIRHSGKTKLIAELLRKTNMLEGSFYFDSELDTL